MDRDRIKGKVKEVEGKLQDARGDLTGNVSDDIKGKAKQVEGKVQQAWGKMKDDARRPDDRSR
jgi:uncharacterized protein YjbJ (UPF0337 family)